MEVDKIEFEKYININLNLILNSENQHLHFDNFDSNNIDKRILVSFMEDEGLIETEEEPNIFYLTNFGYTTLEVGGWSFVTPINQENNETDYLNVYTSIETKDV